MRLFILQAILLSVSFCCTGQLFQANSQPILTGSGNSSAVREGIASLVGNPAGLMSESPEVYISAFPLGHKTRIGHYSAGFAAKLKTVNIGIQASSFGNKLYRESIISTQVSHSIKSSNLGIRVKYNQLSIGDIASEGFTSLDIGIITSVGNNIVLGAIANNINNPNGSNEYTNRLPLYLESAIGLKLDPVFLILSVSKYIDRRERLHLGFDYKPFQYLTLRAGLSSIDFNWHLGSSFLVKEKMRIDLSFSSHAIFGIIQKWGIGYTI